ncbi:protein cornichon homolog 4 isoform X2 [Pteropus medius]|uniref:protein cornichon homolog 4 isoform X2 n=1 Tax=Pteropus vampyrus TaxID=132908 RepID=UPI00196B878B|nr:protein cornichon homolog 4 isoform X2 [Pteropus giganteus]
MGLTVLLKGIRTNGLHFPACIRIVADFFFNVDYNSRHAVPQRSGLHTPWVIPELIGHAIVTVLMLISLHWFIFLLNLPVATWNIYRFIMVPSGNMGVFDPTEIHNRGQLKSHMKEAMIKLGFHLLCFFMYLYSMILALIND